MRTVIVILSGFILIVIAGLSMNSCTSPADDATSQATVDSLRNQVTSLGAGNAIVAQNLAEFDTLDFTVFSNQEWSQFHESHAENIKVYWPDGYMTEGLPVHIEDLMKLFIHAPDTRIKEHPIRIGSGNYTAVTGVMEGTFSHPMPIGDGKFIQPTGKSFRLPMATFGIWENGVMVAEHLFWDNQTYMKQMGL